MKKFISIELWMWTPLKVYKDNFFGRRVRTHHYIAQKYDVLILAKHLQLVHSTLIYLLISEMKRNISTEDKILRICVWFGFGL